MIEKDKLVKAIKHPERVLEVILRRFFSMYIDDRTFIKLDYFTGMRKFPILNKIGFVSPERRYEAPTVARPPQM